MIFQYEKARVYAEDENKVLLAEITFPETADGRVDINHTFVAPSLRGQGIADKLVRAALQQIAEAGKEPVATCPYAVRWFEKHPEELKNLFSPMERAF